MTNYKLYSRSTDLNNRIDVPVREHTVSVQRAFDKYDEGTVSVQRAFDKYDEGTVSKNLETKITEKYNNRRQKIQNVEIMITLKSVS